MKKNNNFKNIPKATYCIDFSSEKPRVSVFSNGSAFFHTELENASLELRVALAMPSNKVIICPPFKSIILSTLTPPPVSRSKQIKLIPSLLNIQLPFKLEECKYVFNRLGSTFLAQTIRNVDLAETIALAGKNKLSPTNIVGYIQLLWEAAIAEAPTWGAETERALCIANENSTLLIIGNNETIISSSAFNNSTAKEIVKRLKLAFKGDISKVALFLAGNASSSVLKDMRDAPALGLINVAQAPEYFVANSCAGAKAIEQYNFIATSRSSTSGIVFSEKLKKKLAAMFLVVGIITFIATSFVNSNTERIKEANQQYFNDATKQVAGYDIKIKGKRAIDEAKAAYEARVDQSIINAKESIVASQKFPKCMELCKKHGVTLGFVSINSNGLTASGSATNRAEVNSLVSELNANGIKCVLTEEPKDNAGRISFQLFPAK